MSHRRDVTALLKEKRYALVYIEKKNPKNTKNSFLNVC